MIVDVKNLVLNNINRLISHNDVNKLIEFSFQIFEGCGFLFIENNKSITKKIITDDLTNLHDIYIYLYESLKELYKDDNVNDRIKLLKIIDYTKLDTPNLELIIRSHHNNKIKITFQSTPYTINAIRFIENDWLELLSTKKQVKLK